MKKELKKIADRLISAGNAIQKRNGLPYCKNCGLDLIELGNRIGRIADKTKPKIWK